MHGSLSLDDDLSDVVLEGLSLVSDDPARWNMCSSLAEAIDLYEWWEELAKWDEASASIPTEVMRDLRHLQNEFEMAKRDLVSSRGRRIAQQLLMRIMEHGFTTHQAAILCGLTQERVTQLLISQRVIRGEEITQRIEAEALLRQGLGPTIVAERCGLSTQEAWYWAKCMAIKSPQRNRYGPAKPHKVRDRAMQMYDQGMRGKEIAAALQAEMPDEAAGVTGVLVGQWASRSGRTKREAA